MEYVEELIALNSWTRHIGNVFVCFNFLIILTQSLYRIGSASK